MVELQERGGRPPRALVVEDDADLREFLVHILEHRGVECTDAGDAETALELAVAGRFDILVTDIKLPGIDGIELRRRLIELVPGLPAVAVTAYLGAWDREDLSDFGFSATIRKPLHIPAFLKICLQVIQDANRSPTQTSLPI